MSDPVVYDKAKYHEETVDNEGLPEEHAFHHTAYFLRWLCDHGLVNEEFADLRDARSIEDFFAQTDGCFIDVMLTAEGNRFTAFYFDFKRGKYLEDYEDSLGGGLLTLFHVPWTDENYRTLSAIIDKRFAAWKKARR